jgi:hypothetical protein
VNGTRAEQGSINPGEGHSIVSGASHLSLESYPTLRSFCKLVVGFV